MSSPEHEKKCTCDVDIAVRELEARLWSILNDADIAIFLKDLNGSYIYINRNCAELLGVSPDDARGKKDQDIFPSDIANLWHADDMAVIEANTSMKFEEQLITDDSLHTFIVFKYPISDSDGVIRSIGGVATDITDRIRSEEALEAERSRLRAVLDSLPVGVFIADAKGNIVEINDTARTIWGAEDKSREALSDYGIYKGWWAETGEPISPDQWALTRAHKKGEASIGELVRIEGFDGSRKTIVLSGAPIRDSEQKIIGGVAAMQDVTELMMLRRTLESSLEETSRERERVSALESIAEAGISTLELDDLLDVLAERISVALKTNICSILIFDEESNQFMVRATYRASGIKEAHFVPDKAFIREINENRRTISVKNAERNLLDGLSKDNVKSLLGTPLIARGRVVGITYIEKLEIREFTNDEIRLLEAMAARAALAIDNANLYNEVLRSQQGMSEALDLERSYSLMLQRALLPAKPFINDNYRTAVHYSPAYKSREIGGDFYDVFIAKDNRAGILIGDVSGKGIEAASLAATARSTAHAFSHDIISSADVLSHTNAVLFPQQPEIESFISVFLCILEIDTGNIRYASGGHPPAVICRRDGSVEFLKFGDPPIGLKYNMRFMESKTHLDPGEKIVLYTDGISEARHEMQMFEIYGIERALRNKQHLSADEVVNELISAVNEWTSDHLSDDAAIVVVERIA